MVQQPPTVLCLTPGVSRNEGPRAQSYRLQLYGLSQPPMLAVGAKGLVPAAGHSFASIFPTALMRICACIAYAFACSRKTGYTIPSSGDCTLHVTTALPEGHRDAGGNWVDFGTCIGVLDLAGASGTTVLPTWATCSLAMFWEVLFDGTMLFSGSLIA
ncbi:hypothetical protein CGRA01v4_13658 [Colletotrichum graminicola]|nr:hypothetical protein CGRA01v4_13658 [Colletotrichum graminicola]